MLSAKGVANCQQTCDSMRSLRGRTFSLSNPPMPWFGMDIGGTLAKLVYFEPTDCEDFPEGLNTEERNVLIVQNIHRYLTSNTAYGETGVRDKQLELTSLRINGRCGSLHFIRFPTSKMETFLLMAKSKGFASFSSTVCATGGGAHKFAPDVKEKLNMDFFKFDELESVIRGIEFVTQNNPGECYYWERPLEENCQKTPLLQANGDRETILDPEDHSLRHPYIVVNIGSGVSVLSVNSPKDIKRISGSSVGGGTFLGLCYLLTKCESFEDALALAAQGDNKKADKLVRDIYGGDYSLFGLSGDLVACSFGQMIHKEKRDQTTDADLARAALVTITNNIGSIARLCANSEKINRVVFVGNFLRNNEISEKLLTHAMDYWSAGTLKAIFLEHEGYFGAVGCLMELMCISEAKRNGKQLLSMLT